MQIIKDKGVVENETEDHGSDGGDMCGGDFGNERAGGFCGTDDLRFAGVVNSKRRGGAGT